MTKFRSFEPKRFSKAKYYQERPDHCTGAFDCSEICSVCGYTNGDHLGDDSCPLPSALKVTKRYSTNPRKGDIRYLQGIRFVHNGKYWEQDGVIENIIDRHHNHAGQQDPKKPYRGGNKAHVTCGAKLCR